MTLRFDCENAPARATANSLTLSFPKTWLLFHNALSEGVVIDDILKYARMNKEQEGVDDDALEGDLRKLVQAQAAELEALKQRVREGVTTGKTLRCVYFVTVFCLLKCAGATGLDDSSQGVTGNASCQVFTPPPYFGLL